MSEFFPGDLSSHESRYDPQEWQKEFKDVVEIVGNALGSSGAMLAKYAHIRLVSGDEAFSPFPDFKFIDNNEIEVTCNTEAFEEWERAIGHVPGVGYAGTRRLYLAAAAAPVELAFAAKTANVERNFVSRSRSMRRSKEIMEKLDTKEELLHRAWILESEHGFVGAREAIESNLNERQVVELNLLRYGLGVAFYALEIEPELQADITEAFRQTLKAELENYEETLMEFMIAFAQRYPYDDIVEKYKTAKRNAFPEFLFAGTIPLGYDGGASR